MELRKYFIKKLGGYTEGEALNDVISQAYKTIRPDDILRIKDGVMTLEDKPLTPEAIKSLKVQAENFLQGNLNKIIDREIRHRTNLQWRQATTFEAHERAKLLEYTWDTVNTILERIKNI